MFSVSQKREIADIRNNGGVPAPVLNPFNEAQDPR